MHDKDLMDVAPIEYVTEAPVPEKCYETDEIETVEQAIAYGRSMAPSGICLNRTPPGSEPTTMRTLVKEKIQVGSRVRWKPLWNEHGLVGHEGTVVTLGHEGPGWAWVRYDDGTEKAAHLTELELI